MTFLLITWFKSLDIKIQACLISAATSIITYFLVCVFKFFYEKYKLKYKLKKEFQFEQRKKLKEEIAENKLHLLNSAEEWSHRLWNFSQYIDDNLHNVQKNDWCKQSEYYINSFVYRFLVYLHWLIESERKTLSVDTTIADSDDILYLKYIKTLKDIFTDIDLFKKLDYDGSHNTHHFYKNDLIGYSKAVVKEKDNKVLDFDEFLKQGRIRKVFKYFSIIKNSKDDKVFEYFSTIKNSKDDKVLNILKCSHLLTISFLNKYGHDYQKTSKKKIKKITSKYKNEITIVANFKIFVEKSKLTKELNPILKKLN